MSKTNLKLGDKVRINRNARKEHVPKRYIGVEGEIVEKVISHFLVIVPKRGAPLMVTEKAIDLIRPEKIIIYRNGAEVIAKNTATGKTGVAKCSPDDEFDFNTGAKLAFERLINPEPVKPKYYTGKVVCAESPDEDFTAGKIYTFENGRTRDNTGWLRPINYRVEDITHYNTISAYTFVPLIED